MVAIHAVVAADLCFSSRLYRAVLPEVAQRVLLTTLIIVSVAYVVLSLLRGYALTVGLATLAGGLIVGQAFVYEINWGMAPNLTGLGQYSVVLCFVVFFVACRDGFGLYAVETLYRYGIGYVVVYLGFVVAYLVGVLPQSLIEPIVTIDAERGGRFYGYLGMLALAWCVSLIRLRERFTLVRLCILLVCFAANLVTLSRVYLLCLTAVTAMSLVGVTRSTMRSICLTLLMIAAAVLIYGLFDTRWNPFFVFTSTDTSGLGRALEYQISQELFARSPLFGLGLPTAPEQPGLLTGLSFYSPSDLGLAGVLLDLGLAGIILFIVASFIACARSSTLPANYADGLFLMGCTLSVYGVISPVLFAPGGAFLFAVILGFWLAEQTQLAGRDAGSSVGYTT